MAMSIFQFTPLREGRREPKGFQIKHGGFQFTPLREGRHNEFGFPVAQKVFQFTPLREGRLHLLVKYSIRYFISIHAPPRGATVGQDVVSSDGFIFQFTPLREGRPGCITVVADNSNFNSRPSARGDVNLCILQIALLISIHAPPRGATHRHERFSSSTLFQFTPLREGRPNGFIGNFLFSIFQFTPLREGRRSPLPLARARATHFNSRPSARGDLNPFCSGCRSSRFQFTPLREGRLSSKLISPPQYDFNSRPSARGDDGGL